MDCEDPVHGSCLCLHILAQPPVLEVSKERDKIVKKGDMFNRKNRYRELISGEKEKFGAAKR